MSPRRNKPRSRGAARPPADDDLAGRVGMPDAADYGGEEFLFRRVSGSAADKSYRCPGCDQEIRPGTPHVVAWPEHSGADLRRHWHSACWNARDRRGTRPQRSRNAPRH